jgi:hypothetical protein
VSLINSRRFDFAALNDLHGGSRGKTYWKGRGHHWQKKRHRPGNGKEVDMKIEAKMARETKRQLTTIKPKRRRETI